ncbi:hypothetical protein HOLleu_00141 [Holothuria leucospilota]|uniref:Uncharacterized protein n=1 Tax=Holothuria leucospilota TaxID=206669 RepID=A0A9Q1CMH0_HOLLE|nr:hypothetical protein HOLleu_00141 [Holothuria leucospilota]
MKTTVVFLILAALVAVSFQSESDESEQAASDAENNRRFWGSHHRTSGDTVSNNQLSNFITGHNTAGNGATGLING